MKYQNLDIHAELVALANTTLNLSKDEADIVAKHIAKIKEALASKPAAESTLKGN